MTEALRHELTTRTLAEAGLRSRLIEAEARLAARQQLEQRTGAVLSQLRGELDGLRQALERERAARRAAEARSERLRSNLGGARSGTQEARQAIAEIRGALESLRTPSDPLPRRPAASPRRRPRRGVRLRAPAGGHASARRTSSTSSTAGAGLEPERLSEALQRLRDQIAPQELAAPSPAEPPTVEPDPPGQPPAAFEPDPPGSPRPASSPTLPGSPGQLPSLRAAPATAAGRASGRRRAAGRAPADPPIDLGPLTVGRPWLRAAFRSLAGSDPDRAGRLAPGPLARPAVRVSPPDRL